MDKEKLRKLIAQKKGLDDTGAALMKEVQQWKEDMLAVVGHQFYDSKNGFMWDLICHEVLDD
jgi:hypothetical protein